MAFLNEIGLERLWTHILSLVGKKVDKIEGKGLSTNDYTTNEKDKLSSISAGAEVNQNAFNKINTISQTVTASVSAKNKTDAFTLKAGANIVLSTNESTGVITITGADAPEAPEASLESMGITATATELNRVAGVTSNIQEQLNVIKDDISSLAETQGVVISTTDDGKGNVTLTTSYVAVEINSNTYLAVND